MSDDEGLQVVSAPKPPRSKKPKEPTPVPAAPAVPAVPAPTVSKPVVPKAVPMDAKYMDKLNKARELALVKKAQARMKQEEDAVNAKVAELKKQKEIELPPVVEPTPVPVAAPVAAPIETPKPKRVRKKPEPKPDKVVERIVEVEKIVYQAPKLNFCFV
jgi:hypothetical protein